MNATPPLGAERPFRVHYEMHRGYLRAWVHATSDSAELSTAYWREVATQVRRLGAKHVLVVEDIEERPSYRDAIGAVETIASLGFDGIRIAFVDLHAGPGPIAESLEATGRARGLDWRFFRAEPEAAAWLEA